MPVGVREIESLLGFVVAGLFFLVWWFYDAISLGILAIPATFFLVFIPALGPGTYRFPSQGVRMSWLVAHIIALLLAYAALVLQPACLHDVPRPGATHQDQAQGPATPQGLVGAARLAAAPRHARAHLHATLEFGFPCMTVGLSLARSWPRKPRSAHPTSSIPKSSPPLPCGLSMSSLLLVRRGAGLRGRKAAYVSGAVLVVMMAVWAANFFSHVHRFGPQ